jgi:AMIN domain
LKTVVISAVLLGGCLQLNAVPVPDSKPTATIRRIAVTGGDHDLEVEITASGPIAFQTQTVTGPDRLIVDFPEALPSGELHKLFVNRGNLRDVRVGLYSANPLVTRIVLDLKSPSQYRVLPFGNTILLKLGAGEAGPAPAQVKVATSRPAEARPAKTASVVAKPLQDRSPEVIRQKLVGSTAILQRVRVLGGNENFEVEIIADQPVVPRTQVVENPNRLIVDFPCVVPSRDLHDLRLNRADVRGIRVGLLMSKPPVTRVVLDLNSRPQFKLFPSGKSVIVELAGKTQTAMIGLVPGGVGNPPPKAVPAVATVSATLDVSRRLRVSLQAGKLSVWAHGASLSEVLYEIHRRTGANIPIPSEAWNERVAVDLGPGPARDVLADLLNGSPFNFVIVGVQGDPSLVSSVQLTLKDNKAEPQSPASASSPPPADAPQEPPPQPAPLPQPEPQQETPPVPPPPTPDTPPQGLQ